MEYKIEWEKHSFLIYIIISFLIYVRSNLEQQEQSKGIKKVYYGIWFGHGLVFIYGVVMYHFAENPEESVRIAGVTVPVSHLLNDDEAALLQKVSTTAKEEGIYLIVSLLVKTPYESLKENKTIAFNPQGE